MNILESVRLSGSKVQVLWIALPLAALLLPGCPLYLDNGHAVSCSVDANCPSGEACIGGTCQRACTSEADCPAGQACIARTCHVVNPMSCTSDAQCSASEHCQAGSCVPGQRVCETHGDCDVGFMCDISACTVSTTCTTDADCTGGLWCDYRNTCVPRLPNECRTANDCTGGDLCIEGSCTHLPSTCQFEYDCPAGTACVNAECTAVCTTDNDCVAGDTCNSRHFCEPTVDCETTAMCATGEHCVQGRCLADCHGGATCGRASRETSYCGSDSFCHPSWQPAVACNLDSDCAAGRLCLAHVCRTPCADGATSQAAGDAQCMSIDSQLPHCILDSASAHYLCNASSTSTASCRTSADCSGTENCVNAACQ